MTGTKPTTRRLHPAERLVFFTDAVVAIAMTLLILPLMESISDASDEGDTLDWLSAHTSQLVSFGLSFVVTAVFWRAHNRLFEHVKAVDHRLASLDFAWMFTIVWLPIATSLSGAMRTFDPETGEYDRVMILVYVGTLTANSLLLYVMEAMVRRDPALWNPDNPLSGRVSEAVALAMTILFGVAAALALAVPPLNMGALFILFLTHPLAQLIQHRMAPLTAAEAGPGG